MPEGLSNPNPNPPRSFDRTAGNSGVDDLGVLSDIQSGSQDAMARFFDRYSKMVYSVALRVLKDSGEAEDVMQEIFVQVWQNPGAFVSGRGSLGGWLVVVARNRAIDKLRRRKPSGSGGIVFLALLNESGAGIGAPFPAGKNSSGYGKPAAGTKGFR